ncbi:hypothetical protein AVEN_244456-1 [Araneus ventricosus]|uniref:Uncharacterized protein n=1 Tax=Araneus ventricosus TaxID=182803 RepID=A0A4Y2PNL3_ARAVE|nr:hypothetical protein AVEN_244456-1 [Araneus ventricosus]
MFGKLSDLKNLFKISSGHCLQLKSETLLSTSAKELRKRSISFHMKSESERQILRFGKDNELTLSAVVTGQYKRRTRGHSITPAADKRCIGDEIPVTF